MKRIGTLVASLVLVGLTAPLAPADEDFLSPEALHEAGLMKFWQLRLPTEFGQELRDAHLVDDQLYIGTQDGYAFALDALTGVLRWMQPVTRSGYSVRRPAHAGDRTIFITPTDAQVYDRLTGEPIRRHELRFPPGTGAISDGTRVFVGGIDHRLYALRADDLFLQWRAITDGGISALPALHGPHVFVANEGGTVYACTRDNKQLFWKGTAFGPLSADLVIGQPGVFAASRDQSLYLFDLNFGELRWRARFDSPLLEPPMVTNDVVFQFCEANGVSAVETAVIGVEDRIRWQLPQGRRALLTNGPHVFIQGRDESLMAVRMADGQVDHVIPAPGFTMGLGAPEMDALFLLAADGRIFCARPLGSKPPRREDLLAALRGAATPETEAAAPPAAPTTQPVIEPSELLRARERGRPIGGKSKVTEEFER